MKKHVFALKRGLYLLLIIHHDKIEEKKNFIRVNLTKEV